MRALTVSQPFASAIADEKKFVENRSWNTNYRGPLAIHAGKGSKYMTAKEIRDSALPFGAVIATCEIQSCIYLNWPDDKIAEALPAWCSLDHFYHHAHTDGPWCWVLGNVRKLATPITAKGFQGFWNWEGIVDVR